jgi:hypothetical protein
MLTTVSVSLGADDTWPQFGHDGALTGRTALKGDIASPREAWSVSLAGESLEIELRPEAGRHALAIASVTDVQARTVAASTYPQLDLDGSGTLRPAVESYHQRWAEVLPDVKGLQRTEWSNTWTTADICRLQLFAYDGGHDQPRKVWESETEATVFMPLTIVYDIDGDGVQEICVALHYRVLVFEGTTGRKETELKFHSSRSYGWFGLADVDADGQREFVVLSDFQSHLDVLDYDPAKPEAERLSVKWRREIEQRIQDRHKWPQIGPRPVADTDGDGKLEIIVNLFNDHGDDAWHTLVLDGATGEERINLPNRYTHGNGDLDGDGSTEVFCTATDGVFVPSFGTVEIIGVKNRKPAVVWSRDGAGFATADLLSFGPTWTTGASTGMQHVLLTDAPKRPAFLVLSRDASVMGRGETSTAEQVTSVSALRHDGVSGVKTLWQVDGLAGEIETPAISSNDGAVSALIRMKLPARTTATLSSSGAEPVIVSRAPLGTPPSAPIAARLSPGGRVDVLAQGAGENLFRIHAPDSSEPAARIVWQRTGRGIGNGSMPGTLLAADLDADGLDEVVASDQTASGAAVLKAYRANGEAYWRHTFAQTPGMVPRHNVGALIYWWPGRFRSADRLDLFVNTRRGLMHSAVGNLLDGRTGRPVWSHTHATVPDVFNWGYAGQPLAVANVTGDARDEIVNLYPVCFWVADGSTGEIIAARDLADRKILPAWAAYGQPIVHDFNGDGEQEVLLDSVYILALLDRNGTPIWHGKRRRDYPTGQSDDNFGETTSIRHALVDFDGDGRFEIASGGYQDGVRAIDPRDGTVLWSLDAPTPTGTKCSAADINGDGGDELLYVAGTTLHVITGDRTGGRELWTWSAPTTLSLPAIADVDGDGRAEIIVQSADGVVRCIDGPAS